MNNLGLKIAYITAADATSKLAWSGTHYYIVQALSKYCGVALEAQNFADAINKPNFPNSILKPDKKYDENFHPI